MNKNHTRLEINVQSLVAVALLLYITTLLIEYNVHVTFVPESLENSTIAECMATSILHKSHEIVLGLWFILLDLGVKHNQRFVLGV